MEKKQDETEWRRFDIEPSYAIKAITLGFLFIFAGTTIIAIVCRTIF